MILQGVCYPADSSARQAAELHLDAANYRLQGVDASHSGDSSSLQFSQRVGNIPRKITLPDGAVFETTDNAAVDTWLAQTDHADGGTHWMHVVESRWRWIAAALVLTLLLVGGVSVWGLPWASKQVALQLPAEVNKSLAEGTLSALDQIILEPSQLPPARQQAIREHFRQTLLPLDTGGFTYTLHFRAMAGVANAFALPSGDIVVTDRLAEIVTKPEELDSILLHEIGHVVRRHSLRQVIQSSGVTLALVILTGDASAVDEWTLALPATVLQSQYSRDFESEADVYAFERMMQLKMDPVHFGNALHRITADALKDSPLSANDTQRAETFLKYLSSHPPSAERAALAKHYSQQYQTLKPAGNAKD
jgi:Zn-dependent protease with chaperone function